MKSSVFLVVTLLMIIGYSESRAVPVTWIDDSGLMHEYELFYAQGISWDEARARARVLGEVWDLATITSAEEQLWINLNVFGNVLGEFWIGGYQNPLNTVIPWANWTWVTGESWSYTNWAPSEPNDWYEHVLEQYLGANWGSNKQWNDEGYLVNIQGYVAEQVIPEPTTIWLMGTGLLGLFAVRRRQYKHHSLTTAFNFML